MIAFLARKVQSFLPQNQPLQNLPQSLISAELSVDNKGGAPDFLVLFFEFLLVFIHRCLLSQNLEILLKLSLQKASNNCLIPLEYGFNGGLSLVVWYYPHDLRKNSSFALFDSRVEILNVFLALVNNPIQTFRVFI